MKYSTNKLLKSLENTDTKQLHTLDGIDLGTFPSYRVYKESDSLKFNTLHSRMKYHLLEGVVDLDNTKNLIEEAYKFFLERFDVITTTELSKEQIDLVNGMQSVWMLYALRYTIEHLSEIDENYFRENDFYLTYNSSPYVIDSIQFGKLTMVVIDKKLEESAQRKKMIQYSYSNN